MFGSKNKAVDLTVKTSQQERKIPTMRELQIDEISAVAGGKAWYEFWVTERPIPTGTSTIGIRG